MPLRKSALDEASAVVVRLLGGIPRDPFAFHLALAGENACFLESSLLSEGGRRSYSLPEPRARLDWSAREGLSLRGPDAPHVDRGEDPFSAAEKLLASGLSGPPRDADLPFAGGAVAFVSYEAAALFEERAPRNAPDPLGAPDVTFLFFDRGVVLDHERGIAVGFAARDGSEAPERFFARAAFAARTGPVRGPAPRRARLASDFGRDEYVAAVERVKRYIEAGDVYQVNLSQRFRVAFDRPPRPEEVYFSLRAENPSPFAVFADLGPGRHVLSASPELFLSRRGRSVSTRPIKGTRPRVRLEPADEESRRDLLASEKDRAELTMIVDLERNDLGRVCEAGSVRVADAGSLETHPWVYHRVATVRGTLREGTSLRDLLGATFPTGSVTGAPKIRAMEIIAELERARRGVYTGAIGWIGWDGDLDLNVAIRTIEMRGGEARFHVGGGIVADSDARAEYEETLHKARGLLRALGLEGEPPRGRE